MPTSPAASVPTSPLLTVDGLTKHFPVSGGVLFGRSAEQLKAVDGISFTLDRGETLGVVGETGCGKSTTGRMLAGLLPPTAGRMTFDDEDLTWAGRGDRRRLSRDIQMIFQDPYSSLNPRHTVGTIVGAPFRYQKVKPPGGIRATVQRLLEQVGLSPEHYNRYPNEFSGGQRQRIGIARAIALNPRLIVADEPVSALDVSVQAQVINLLTELKASRDLTLVFIAHDLSVVRHIADRVAVMYLGKIVELASSDDLYSSPRHPYATALMSAAPVMDPRVRAERTRIRLKGEAPSPLRPPTGCRFQTRCWKAEDICRSVEPPLVEAAPAHQVACHFPEGAPARGDGPAS
jgi:peptide/nickel transport system ATP-binding protein/oligopeptide transport system ATP-binding protein